MNAKKTDRGMVVTVGDVLDTNQSQLAGRIMTWTGGRLPEAYSDTRC
jgi:hypothetical protein